GLVRLRVAATASDARLPQGVREVVRHRLGTLSRACHELLTAAAVVGLDFEPSLVGTVAHLPLPRVIRLLEEAKQARLVEQAPASDRHRFVQSLVREVLYGELPSRRRRHLHSESATAIEGRCAGDLNGREAELAHHYREAGAPLDLERALEL